MRRVPPELWKKVWTRQAVGQRIASIKPTDLKPTAAAVNRQSGHEVLCSFNWASCNTSPPTIYVPGAPRKYTPPPSLPFTLPKDTRPSYVDQNAARSPSFPFAPLLAALHATRPSFTFSNAGLNGGPVDVLADRSSLRRLLRFAAGSAPRDSFRVDCSVVGATLVLRRRDRITRSRPAADRPQWGDAFELGCTAPAAGLADAVGHYRVLRYRLADLECVVQCEIDACVGDGVREETAESAPRPRAAPAPVGGGGKGAQLPGPVVRRVGREPVVPSERLAEMKTLSARPQSKVRATAQLWFGRTQWLITGRHRGGVFTSVTVEDVEERFAQFEEANQDALRKLVYLLKRLRNYARSNGGRCVVLCEKEVKPLWLEVFRHSKKGGKQAGVPTQWVHLFLRKPEQQKKNS